jgi:hypothetical protein
MKSYTFAKADEPVVAHMRGLQEWLRHCIENERHVADRATIKRDKDYCWAKIRAYEDVIDLIEHSHSTD